MPVHLRVPHFLAVAIIASSVPLAALAQYSGPTAIGKGSVAAILENPVDDQDVKLQGHLLRKIGHDEYIFSDGTAEIVAEIKNKRFPDQPIDEKTKVEIIGEVDTGMNRPPEIEVDSLQVMQ